MSRDTASAVDAIVDAARKVAAEQPNFMVRYVLFFQKDTPNSNGINTLNAGIFIKAFGRQSCEELYIFMVGGLL